MLTSGLEPEKEHAMAAFHHAKGLEGPRTHYISTFYQFFPIANLEETKGSLESWAKSCDISGLIILGPEGLNATVSSPQFEGLEAFKDHMRALSQSRIHNFKDSRSEQAPFRRFVVKVRDEIVTLGTPELVPGEGRNHHLSPAEWNRVLSEEKDFVLIDTRNWYETQIGTFKGAINPRTDRFAEFPEFMDSQSISKEKKVLIFCTGGIRCEKGILELQRQGYDNVYQLEGGILNYLKEFPNEKFEGECFVFDRRVAVDQNLRPTSKYGLCPHCGQPAAIEMDCVRCGTHAMVCDDCRQTPLKAQTCSKNCAYHWDLHPGRRADPQVRPAGPYEDASPDAKARSC